MGRVENDGLDYYPKDVGIYEDIKIMQLIKRYGGNGFTIYDRLLCLIFKDTGYYIAINKGLYFYVSYIFPGDVDEKLVTEVVEFCMGVELFNVKMRDNYNILTSVGIQKRWLYIVKKLKRKNQIIKNEFCLVPECKMNNHGGKADNHGGKADNHGGKADNHGGKYTNNISTFNSNNKGIGNEENKELIINNKIKTKIIKEEITTEEKPITTEEKPITTEEKPITTEEKPITTEEKPITTEEKPITTEEINFYEGQWLIEIPISYCLSFFLKHRDFANDRQKVFEKIKYILMDLPDDEVWERIEQWGKRFNERNEMESPTRTMRGKGCWPQHFYNWITKQNLKENPIQLNGFHKNGGGKPKGKIPSIANGYTQEEIDEHYTYKPKFTDK